MQPGLFRLSIVSAAVFVLAACSGSGGAPTSGSAPTIDQAWVRPAPAGAETAAYFTITGAVGQADALLSASSPGGTMVELHEVSTDTTGMTGMHPIARLDIPAGGTVRLEPGGFHLMITGLTSELAVGGTLELDLVFEHAGTVKVQAEIRKD